MTCQYRVLENVALADAAFEAYGDSPAELFVAAAQAVIDTMADATTVRQAWRRTITREADDLSGLLFDWLSELVYLKDAEAVVFSGASAHVEQSPDGRWHLCGTLTGEPIDPARQALHADVKAVTKHLYDVRHVGNQWMARVVLDI